MHRLHTHTHRPTLHTHRHTHTHTHTLTHTHHDCSPQYTHTHPHMRLQPGSGLCLCTVRCMTVSLHYTHTHTHTHTHGTRSPGRNRPLLPDHLALGPHVNQRTPVLLGADMERGVHALSGARNSLSLHHSLTLMSSPDVPSRPCFPLRGPGLRQGS